MQITFNIHIDDRFVNFLKRFFGKKRNLILVAMTVLLSSAALYAATMDWVNLQPGDPVSASDLNTRFNALKDAVTVNQNAITANQDALNVDLQLEEESGHADLSSGLQIRWGVAQVENDGTVTFSKPFSNACFTILTREYADVDAHSRNPYGKDVNGFKLHRGSDYIESVHYLAIGF